MMKETFLSRFTPSMMNSEALEAIFVQREELARRIVGLIRDSTLTEAKHHTLLVGPRGIGKTHFVSLIYHRVRKMEDLRTPLLIAWLREDEWGVASFLDLLLRILRALLVEYEDAALAARVESLYELPPDAAEQSAAALLKEFAADRTLLILMENLDELFAGLADEGQKQLRAYLQENPFCTILATSQSLFGGVSLQTSPFYGFFRIQHLEDLSLEEATQLLTNIAAFKGDSSLASFIQTPTGRARIRAVRHLAGGNHRVYVILSQFLTRESLDKLVEPFMRMLDDLTPYYHARMQWLSPQQRKIIEFLCERRSAVTVKEIAQRSFMTHQTASSQLKTLREMGYVKAEPVGRESYYELREPLMRLSIEVKTHREQPIRLFIDFLRLWHSQSELQQQLTALKPNALLEREYLTQALREAESEPEDPRIAACSKDLRRYFGSGDYINALEVTEELAEIRGSAGDWVMQGRCLRNLGRWNNATDKFTKAIEIDAMYPTAYGEMGAALWQLERFEESLIQLDKAVELKPDFVFALAFRGLALEKLERWEEASASFDKVVKLNHTDATSLVIAATISNYLNRWEDALQFFNKAIEMDAEFTDAWSGKGDALYALSRFGDALPAFDEAIKLGTKLHNAFFKRVVSLVELNLWNEGKEALDNALSRFANEDDAAAECAEKIIRNLLTKEREVEIWRERAGQLVGMYDKHYFLPALGQGIVRNISKLNSPMVSDTAAQAWRDVWQESAEGHDELQLSLRLLDAAVRYRVTKDQRVLLELPAEERAVLEETLRETGASD